MEARRRRSRLILPARARRRAARAFCAGGTCSSAGRLKSWNAPAATAQLAMGDGPSFVSQDLFNEVVFGGNPSERQARLEAHLASLPKDEAEKLKALWNAKPDDWGNPLRPANLNRGVYKGGQAAARHFLADRQGNQRGADAGALPVAARRQESLGPGELRAGTAL